MTVSSSTNRVSYSGNGSLATFAYGFKVFDQDDLTVILRASNGTETVQTITTDYTVTGVGDVGGGNVVFGTAPASGVTVVILREMDLEQGLDLVPNDPFPAQSLENSLDKLTFMVQQHDEQLGRAIKASRTNVISGSEFTISEVDRANKVFAFDSAGDVSITQEIGVYRGDWAAGVAYNPRDIVKDSGNANIYLANAAHTSSGSLPISTNADIAKWNLLVDAAAAATSATAAAASEAAAQTAQTAAETAQTAAETAQASAETAETNAETAETNAETAQTAAEAAQAAAETVYDNFDDRYLGAKSTSGGDPTLDNDGDALIDGALFFDTTNNVMKVYNLGTTTWLRTTPTGAEQTNINTVSGIAANVTTVSGISGDVTTVAGNSANTTTVAGISANVTTVAGISADVSTVASNVSGVQNFAEVYRVGATDPTNSLDSGDLFYNTTASQMKVYNGSAWEAGVLAGSGTLLSANNLSDLTDTAAAIANLGITADPTLGTLTKSFASGETASVSLSSSVSPTAVVAVTKEVGQTGVSSKGAWDVASDASNYELYNEAPATSLTIEGWDISIASHIQSFSVADQDTTPYSVSFKPDGTKMYVVGSLDDDVNEYNLSTAWDISSASYNQKFSVSAQDTAPRGIFFKPDGTKMYVIGGVGVDVNEYNLSTAWDISTSSYNQNFSVSAQDTTPTGIYFKDDGLKMYVAGSSGDAVYEYNLSAAWDISEASYLQSFSVAAQDTAPYSVFFKPDGFKMYIAGGSGDSVYEYNLSAAWDVSAASYSQNVDVSAQDTVPYSVFFKPDGTKMYVAGSSGDSIYEYSVAKATLGTGSFSSPDLGKRIFVDDGGEVYLTATGGSCFLVSDFGASSYTSGNWSLSGLDVDATNGITLSEYSTAWNVSQASYLQAFSFTQTGPNGFFFKPDGTRVYIAGTTGDEIEQFDLTTAWDISTASTAGVFDVGSFDSDPVDLFFKPDGSKMFVLGSSQDAIDEFELSTAWDVTSASSRISGYSIDDVLPEGLFFKPDGTKMYTVGAGGDDGVDEYNLSRAWESSTASLSQRSIVIPSPRGIFFRQDGLKAYITRSTLDDKVYEYNLTTAWDISTLSFLQSFDVTDQDSNAEDVFFHPLGHKMYVLGASNDSIYEYDVGSILQPTAQYLPSVTSVGGQIDSQYWTDINSMTADDTDNDGEVYYAVSTDDRTTWSIAKASDGERNIVRNNGGTWEYNSATGLVGAWDISTASYSQSLSVNAEEATPSGVFFKPDGFKVYIIGFTGDEVNEYDLSTAWDISTASFLQNFSVSAQETGPAGLFFKSDGLKMYIIGQSSGDAVYEYNLSTAWDVSTASYNQNFSVSAQHTVPQDVFFKPDGTKMYVVGNSTDRVSEYSLSTAWDISTASYSQNFSVAAQEAGPRGLFFKSDGSKMYIAGDTGDEVNEYNLSTAWDVSTASFLQNFSVASQDTAPQGVFFKPDGFRMYVVGGAGDAIYEYDIGEQGYTTSETWNSATTNNEFAAIAQAMTVTTNQMDKAQIDAVTDGSHFTLGDTLDLAIVPYLASNGAAPTSDGLSINYDAAALNKGAILGTDYDYDVPAGDVVRITSLATQNLKVRIV